MTIIISKNKNLQRKIIKQNNVDREKYEKNSIPYNKIIAPNTFEIMKLLLSNDYKESLLELFVKYIAPKHISPFESKVSKYKYFDQKKEKIIYDLISKKLDNLFIIGGNRSGKSYLLSRIEVNLKEKNNNVVKFIQKNSYEHIYNFIHQEIKKLKDNNIIFLIDDVDNFILDKDTYRIFSYFKELSSQKNVFFIMAGFWTLYKEINLKEKSFLKGFANVKNISDSLDFKLASDMINTYMKILKIEFESKNIIDDIINQTGGKLDLINLISHELLKEVNYETKIITKKDLRKVLISKKITEYIDNLDKFNDNTLERIIIYGMLKKDTFGIEDVRVFLNDYAIDITVNDIRCYLKKLEIYDIFDKKDKLYSYKNLLFQKSLLEKKDTQQILETSIKNYNSILPTVKKILDNPMELYHYPYLKLHTIYKQLEHTKSIYSVINRLQIEKKSFEIVQDAFSKKTHNSFNNMIRLFSEKIKSNYTKEKNYYLIKVSDDFPLGIQEFIIHFSNEKDYKVIKSLFSQYRITILITTRGTEAQNSLYENTLDKTDKFIAPKSDEITQLFLDPSNENVLNTISDIFSRHLTLNFISPYQANQSVDNSSMFFGREQLIMTVTQREPKNYLIVGARRVGKSSLLKALHRKIKNNRDIESFYLTLSHSNLEQKLIEEVLELNDISTFRALKLYLKKQKKKHIFFIDEVDDFIEEDRKNNYNILKILREMSEEKYVFFVLAGFWQLYQSKWEYQSPLLNFGEMMEIAELEIDACRSLIIQPMKSMGINFESEKLVEKIIFKLGQKAQLISLICHILVDIVSKSPDKYCITETDIKMALNHDKITKELGKWTKLARNPKDNILQKIIIYSMLEHDTFNLYDIDCFLKKQSLHINHEDIEYNLELLVLSFYLKEENHQFSFRIPRQRELLLDDNVQLKLEGNIRKLKD
ncbi:MAG TPA: ATP-binding protein [Bacteroidetes bacterium]|nr:ATP-binding protein [Bacteroidota bacterium]